MKDLDIQEKKLKLIGLILISLSLISFFFISCSRYPINDHKANINQQSRRPISGTEYQKKSIIPVWSTNPPLLEYKTISELQWGENPPMVGGKSYDPGSGNGVSGGAMPLGLSITSAGEIVLADGYGPRLLYFDQQGAFIRHIDLWSLRPAHFHRNPALSGFQSSMDYMGRWHILDMEKRQIDVYTPQGLWIQGHSIDEMLKKQYRVYDVHPVFRVLGRDRYFLQLTVSSPEQSPDIAWDDIPVMPYRIIGLWLDTCYGDMEETSPDFLPWIYGLDSWHIDVNASKWSIIARRWEHGQWAERTEWQMEGVDFQGGDIIGMDHQACLYWWHSRDEIGCLDTIQNNYSIWKLPAYQVYHPVSVHPQGGLLLLDSSKHSLRLIRWQSLSRKE